MVQGQFKLETKFKASLDNLVTVCLKKRQSVPSSLNLQGLDLIPRTTQNKTKKEFPEHGTCVFWLRSNTDPEILHSWLLGHFKIKDYTWVRPKACPIRRDMSRNPKPCRQSDQMDLYSLQVNHGGHVASWPMLVPSRQLIIVPQIRTILKRFSLDCMFYEKPHTGFFKAACKFTLIFLIRNTIFRNLTFRHQFHFQRGHAHIQSDFWKQSPPNTDCHRKLTRGNLGLP